MQHLGVSSLMNQVSIAMASKLITSKVKGSGRIPQIGPSSCKNTNPAAVYSISRLILIFNYYHLRQILTQMMSWFYSKTM